MVDRRRRAEGANTYERILRAAADLASLEGLERVTIGRLADELAMSKSGLFAHFGSKEELHLAAIEAARQRFVAAVIEPALKAPRGIARLEALCQKVIDYIAKPEFPGGCFFDMTRAEFHMRPGPVRDAIMANKQAWRQLLVDVANQARTQGELASNTDTEQLAFELEAVLDLPSWSVGDDSLELELQRARRGVDKLLGSARPPAAQRPPLAKRSRQRVGA